LSKEEEFETAVVIAAESVVDTVFETVVGTVFETVVETAVESVVEAVIAAEIAAESVVEVVIVVESAENLCFGMDGAPDKCGNVHLLCHHITFQIVVQVNMSLVCFQDLAGDTELYVYPSLVICSKVLNNLQRLL